MPTSSAGPAGSARRDVSTLARGAAVALVARLAGQAAHFLTLVAIARVLGAAALGLYSVGWTVFRVVGLLAPLGLANGVIRFGNELGAPAAERFRRLVALSLALALGASGLAAAAWYLASPWLASQLFGKPELLGVFRLFAPGLPAAAALAVAAAATRVSKQMRYSAYSEDFGQPFLAMVSVLALLALGRGVPEIVVATVASFAAGLLVALLFLGRVKPVAGAAAAPPKMGARRLLAFSLPTAWAALLTMALMWVDRLFIAAYRPLAEAGIYQAVSQMALLFILIKTGFSAVLQPMIAELLTAGERRRLESLFRISTKWGIYCATPVFCIVLMLPAPLLGVLFGAEFAAGDTALVVLLGGQFLGLAAGSVGYLLIMSGRQIEWLRLTALALVIDIVLNALLIPTWGLEGAAAATAVALVALFGSGLFRVRFALGLWPYDRRFWKLVPATGLCLAGIALGRWLDLESQLAELLLASALGVTLFTLPLVLAGGDPEDRMILSQGWRRLRPRSG